MSVKTILQRSGRKLRMYYSNVDAGITYVAPVANVTYLGTAASNYSNYSNSLSVSHTLSAGSNRIAFVLAVVPASVTISSVTYGGTSMTLITSASTSGETIAAYYLLEASLGSDGSKTVVVNTDSLNYITMQVWTVSDASQAAMEDTDNTFSASATNLSRTLTCTSGAMAFTGFHTANDGISITHGTGQTEILETDNTGIGDSASSRESVSAGSNTQSSTASGAAIRCCMVAWSVAKAS